MRSDLLKNIHINESAESWHAMRLITNATVWFWVIRQLRKKGRRIDRVSKDSPPSFYLHFPANISVD
jgi:hypothetical protein